MSRVEGEREDVVMITPTPPRKTLQVGYLRRKAQASIAYDRKGRHSAGGVDPVQQKALKTS